LLDTKNKGVWKSVRKQRKGEARIPGGDNTSTVKTFRKPSWGEEWGRKRHKKKATKGS